MLLFPFLFFSTTDSEDEKRVVKSQKDRAWDTMQESILRIKNARKTNDWSVIQDEFEEVNRMVDKSKMLVMKNGLPKFYVKMLADVEDHLWATLKDKDLMNSVKPAIGRAINRMKLTIKKHNKNYEEQIADYRAHPEKYEDDEEEEDDDDDDDSDDDDSDSDSDDDKPKTKSSKAKQVLPPYSSYTRNHDHPYFLSDYVKVNQPICSYLTEIGQVPTAVCVVCLMSALMPIPRF